MHSPIAFLARASLGLALLAPSSQAAVSYAPAVTYPVGSQPICLAIGDLNGDGRQDLAVCNATSNNVTVLLGSGTGTFAAGVNYAVGSVPVNIALGDLDGDGDLDMAVANRSGTNVSILLNDGAGVFTPAPGSPIAIGAATWGVALGDFNGDGRPDLAVAASGANTVAILLGNGTGGFAPAPGSPIAVGTDPFGVAVGRLDGDAHLDLVVTNRLSDNLTVLKGDGTGTFTVTGTYAAGNGPVAVALVDLDGDGKLDLVASHIDGSNDLTIRLGDGSGGFGPASAYAVGGSPWTFAVGDADVDGRPDVVVGNLGSDSLTIALGNGDGTFQAPVAQAMPDPRGVAIGDFNGDGGPDLAVVNQSLDTVSILLSLPSLPGAPTIGTATGGSAQISVTFTAPASNGGSAILDYTATCGAQSSTGAASPLVVTGLTNGTAYTCTVVARNGVGTGPASGASNSATPMTVPDAPTGATATAGNAQVTVAFTPAGDGGSPILDFTATCGSQSTTGAGSPLVVTGLTNGTPYTCTVTARNAAGSSAPSTASNSATPVTVPGAPTGVTATAGNAQVTVAFTAPASNGGSAILDYTATCGSQSVTGAASPLVVTGLTNGTAYTCTVTARNAVGTGPASAASNSATPTVNTYSGPSATGTGTITASFTGGGPTCTYTVSRFIPLSGDPASPPAGTAPAGTTFPHGLFDFTTAGCAPGSTITMTITYSQALQNGTQYWKYGPTPTNPAPHWYVLPATIAGNSVTFTITDGQLGDDDLAANGTIVDQGGPGTPGSAVAVPTLSEWAMLLLAGLVMLAGMGAVRRRA
ncbi:MAG: IPTL-CTERM sorting domain-containing protein [Burkholderiales bacterium]|nr:IPTL-CTERM sorting domain-containing protein [Burkholderiales bacterium]